MSRLLILLLLAIAVAFVWRMFRKRIAESLKGTRPEVTKDEIVTLEKDPRTGTYRAGADERREKERRGSGRRD